jgi:O-antigen biosynthesis protein WbqP
MYPKFKRLFDFTVSIFILITLIPILAIIALIIFSQDGYSPLFKQTRIGKNGKKFTFFKFRSMPLNTPNVQSNEVSKLSVTPFGKFIRRTNLDELPQLLNIVNGSMSFIGPRPCIPTQFELIELREKNGSIKAKPGLTGWAQVNSYDYMPNTVKANFDYYYYCNMSILLDVKIIFKTLSYLTKTPPTY